MLELLHAVITSLLLSAAAGVGTGQAATGEEEPANSETGIEVGQLPTQLTLPRDTRTQTKAEQDDDYQPTACLEQVAFCEPAVCVDALIPTAAHRDDVLALHTSGRSP